MQKALFLDRDGVINTDIDYLYRVEDCVFIEGIFDLARAAQAHDYLILIITNQSGIARGYYSEADFARLTDWMEQRFAEQDVHITHTYYCPYHPDAGIDRYRRDSDCRKPNPGMLFQAQRDFDIDLENSVMIGDKPRDIEAAERAGIRRNYLFGGTQYPTLRSIRQHLFGE